MTIKWVSVQVKRREIFGWAVESWPRGTRVPGACDKEKVANRSEAREVEKLVGQATWCIRGCGDMDQRPEKAKGALLGSMNRAMAFVSYGGIMGQRTLECAHGLRLPPKEACCPGSLSTNGAVLKGGTF